MNTSQKWGNYIPERIWRREEFRGLAPVRMQSDFGSGSFFHGEIFLPPGEHCRHFSCDFPVYQSRWATYSFDYNLSVEGEHLTFIARSRRDTPRVLSVCLNESSNTVELFPCWRTSNAVFFSNAFAIELLHRLGFPNPGHGELPLDLVKFWHQFHGHVNPEEYRFTLKTLDMGVDPGRRLAPAAALERHVRLRRKHYMLVAFRRGVQHPGS